MELRTAVASAFGLELPSTFAFDYPARAAMAAYILQALAQRDVHPSHAMVRKDACVQLAVIKTSHVTPCLRHAGAQNEPWGCDRRRNVSGGRSFFTLSFGNKAQLGRAGRAARRQPVLA